MDKRILLGKFSSALSYISKNNEFGTVDLQRFLSAGYGDTTRIIDALMLLGTVEKAQQNPVRYAVNPLINDTVLQKVKKQCQKILRKVRNSK